MKKLLLITLILSALFSFGCSKNDTSNIMVKLNKVDISSLNNIEIKRFIDEVSQEEGVYQIQTKSNTYIYFCGIENEFTDINCNIEDNTLNIKTNLKKLDSNTSLSQKLYVIYQKNMTSSGDKTIFFDTIKLSINDEDSSFKSVFIIE